MLLRFSEHANNFSFTFTIGISSNVPLAVIILLSYGFNLPSFTVETVSERNSTASKLNTPLFVTLIPEGSHERITRTSTHSCPPSTKSTVGAILSSTSERCQANTPIAATTIKPVNSTHSSASEIPLLLRIHAKKKDKYKKVL